MRKDVILGMSIGGVMLAVVIVYLTVSPNGKHNKHAVQVDNGGVVEGAGGSGEAQDPGGVAETNPPTATDHGGAKATEPANPKKTAEEMAPAKPAVAGGVSGDEKNDPRWGPLLWTNRTPLIGVSQTPDPSGNAADSAGDQGSGFPRTGQIPTGDASPPPIVTPPGSNKPSNTPSDPLTVSPAPSTRPAGKMTTHKVAANETFSTIAATYYGSANYYPHILRANPKLDPSRLKVGTIINLPDRDSVIPPEKPAAKPENAGKATDAAEPAAHRTVAMIDPTKEYRVVAGDSLHKIALKLYGKIDMVDKIYELNKATIGEDRAKLKLGMILKLPQAPTAKQ